MSFIENYLSKVGSQSGDAMKTILYELLAHRYRTADHDDSAKNWLCALWTICSVRSPLIPNFDHSHRKIEH
jgi:hypothetical protein